MRFLFLLCLSTTVIAINSFGQWDTNVDSNALVVCQDSVRAIKACKFVEDGNGGVFVFTEIGQFGVDSNRSIAAQKIRSDGFLEWGNSYRPKMVYSTRVSDKNVQLCTAVKDGQGGAYVLMKDVLGYNNDNGLNIRRLFLQHIKADGSLLWDSLGITVINASDSITEEHFSLCNTTDGGVVVAWEKGLYRIPPFIWDNSQIFLQKYSYDGQRQWDADGYVLKPGSIVTGNEIVPDGAGGVYVVYQQIISGDSGRVYVQKIDQNGVPRWGDGLAVSTRPESQGCYAYYSLERTAIADNMSGIFLSFQVFPSQAPRPEMWMQRIDSNGNRLWGDSGRLICRSNFRWNLKTLLPDGNNGVMVATQEKGTGLTDPIHVRKISNTGASVWGTEGIEMIPDSNSASKVDFIVKDSSGNFVICFVNDFVNGPKKIRLNKVNIAGQRLWGPVNDPLLLTSGLGSVYYHTVFSSTGDDIIVLWWGSRNNGPKKIYAAKLTGSGSPAESKFYYAIQDGNWNDPLVWKNGEVPGPGSVVIIQSHVTVTADASCNTIRIEAPQGQLTVNTGVNFIITR